MLMDIIKCNGIVPMNVRCHHDQLLFGNFEVWEARSAGVGAGVEMKPGFWQSVARAQFGL